MKQLERSVRHFLREARWRTGLTQQDLAERSGLSIRTISDIERGYVRRPRAATLRLLARALGMTDAQTADLQFVVRQGADARR
jgi:transcriptional regulator with XRE-family HTH domain